jgi:hypothetical protein
LLNDQSGSVLGDSTVFSWADCHILAGLPRKEAPEVKKEEAGQENIEGATHNEGGPIQGIKIR